MCVCVGWVEVGVGPILFFLVVVGGPILLVWLIKHGKLNHRQLVFLIPLILAPILVMPKIRLGNRKDQL